MKNIFKAEELPENEKVYLKKDFKGWRVVHPIKNEDGTINLFNIITGGSWWNLIIVGVIVLITLAFLFEYSSNINSLLDCFRIPGELSKCIELYGS